MSRRLSILVFAVMAVFFACFFVAPIWTTLRVAFADANGGFTLDHIAEVFRNPLYRQGLWNSFLIGCFSTIGCVALGLPLALVFTRCEFPASPC